jgi:hypothetical protein
MPKPETHAQWIVQWTYRWLAFVGQHRDEDELLEIVAAQSRQFTHPPDGQDYHTLYRAALARHWRN